jgi:Ca-activated chloride channel family protein
MTTVLAISFRHAGWLWLLVAIVALGAVYVAMQARRQKYTVRFTNLELLDKVAPNRPGWRRHAPATAYLLALVVLVLAVAGPFHQHKVARNRATVVLAIDTSLSMMADDVAPSRLRAAKDAAIAFLSSVPNDVNIGLVSFNGHARLDVAPTTDRATVKRNIEGLQLGESTAIGDAIETGLDAIDTLPPAPDGRPVPAYIVLLSDGTTTVGTSNAQAARDAKRKHVPVETIAFGTQGATITIQGQTADVSVDRDALAAIAKATGGKAFTAESADQIRSVYQDIGKSLAYENKPSDLTPWFVGGGLVFLLVASGLSLAWFNRLP